MILWNNSLSLNLPSSNYGDQSTIYRITRKMVCLYRRLSKNSDFLLWIHYFWSLSTKLFIYSSIVYLGSLWGPRFLNKQTKSPSLWRRVDWLHQFGAFLVFEYVKHFTAPVFLYPFTHKWQLVLYKVPARSSRIHTHIHIPLEQPAGAV